MRGPNVSVTWFYGCVGQQKGVYSTIFIINKIICNTYPNKEYHHCFLHQDFEENAPSLFSKYKKKKELS